MGELPVGGYGSWGKLPHADSGDSICLHNTMFLSSRAGQETWDLLATKE